MRKAHLMESIQAWIEKFIEQAQQKVHNPPKIIQRLTVTCE